MVRHRGFHFSGLEHFKKDFSLSERGFSNGASEWNRTTDLGLMSPTL